MQYKDLDVLYDMPFLFWAKNKDGKYIWGNRSISNLAKEDVVGKSDDELIWVDNAKELQDADEQVWETREPCYLHEHVVKSTHGDSILSVCKFLGQLDGKEVTFGVSFVIEE